MTPETRARIERAVSELADRASVVTERNEAIREARREGASYRAIADVAKIDPMAVRKIVLKENTQ